MSSNVMLVICNDAVIEDRICTAITNLGLNATWLETAKEAYDFVDDELSSVCLVAVILTMDDEGEGLELCRVIKSVPSCPPILVVKDRGEHFTTKDCRRFGADAVCPQPLNQEVFEQAAFSLIHPEGAVK